MPRHGWRNTSGWYKPCYESQHQEPPLMSHIPGCGLNGTHLFKLEQPPLAFCVRSYLGGVVFFRPPNLQFSFWLSFKTKSKLTSKRPAVSSMSSQSTVHPLLRVPARSRDGHAPRGSRTAWPHAKVSHGLTPHQKGGHPLKSPTTGFENPGL